MKHDLFDRIMTLPLLRPFRPFYLKHKEVLLYLLFGGLTTVVGVASFAVFYQIFCLNEHTANVLSWILAVCFAYVTNRLWVFSDKNQGAKAIVRQMTAFFAGRLGTLGMEELILLLAVTRGGLPALPVKIAAQFLVIVLNYMISKLLVFRHG